MNEIIFRGMTKDKDWYYGNLIQAEKNGTIHCFIIQDYEINEDTIKLNTCASPEVLPETLGQYTGLKDKNGKGIYEGDILKFSDVDTAKVKWSNEYSSFIVKPIEDYYFDNEILGNSIENNYGVKVIGNIYDNPELLEED